jgi:class 3 adenylate cyclase
MQQVADWLEKLGLGQYAQRFAENDIDFALLTKLTDANLKELGVTSLGHRIRLLEAIGESAAASAAPTLAEPKSPDTAERRQVTVMFSDLVGSTTLSARMDPEDLRDVISAYQKCVGETVQRLGGFVAKYMGDGVLVYFGYPQAHEDDAERAVRAGLELVASVGRLKSQPPLQTRVGIATGLVVVGDLIGSGAAQEQAVVGETPNLAARLQGVAEPDRVVIAESTRGLVGSLFELEDLGAKDLKGIAGSVFAWAALRPASIESRFEALHASGLTELVGREEELELLLRRWSKAKTGEGQVVLVSGEAGIGKSRLTAALLERLATEPHTRVRYFCSPQHTDSAFFPIIGQMERAAGLKHEDTSLARLDKFDALLAQTSTSRQDAALIAEMLSLPNDGRYSVLELTPEQRRQKTMEALTAQVEVLSRQNPLLMIFEDAHWTDPTSLEVFGRAVDRIATLRVLLIVTFRPEFQPPWIGRPHVTTLTLNRLTRREIDAMIDRVVGNKPIPPGIRQDIIERTDGIPLFVEEMTRAELEAESEGEARRTAATVPSPARAVPARLQASLMARLDRLGAAKKVAQIGAAIGREFSHTLLSAVVSKAEPELASALERLIAAGLLFRQGVPPHASYLFKHALVQDAAYGSLLREPRRALHARIAEVFETQFTEIAESQPELVAQHFAEGAQFEKAATYWLKAGRKAVARSAMAEAVAQLEKGLGILAAMPISPESHQQELDVRLALAPALMATHGMAAPVVREAYARARHRLEYLSVPLFLVGPNGDLLFYNEPAEAILGRRFDEAGTMSGKEWSSAFTPEDSEGHAIPLQDIPLMITITKKRPAYQRFFIRGLDGVRRHVEVASIPIAGLDGDFLGGAALFWEVSD